MFSNLIMVIIVLLLISMSASNNIAGIGSPGAAFIYGIFLYIAFLGLIFLQNSVFKRKLRQNKGLVLAIVNLELLAFLGIYHFILGSQRIFNVIFPDFQTPALIFSLFLYLFGLWVFHYSSYDTRRSLSAEDTPSSAQHATLLLRMIVPFVIPFVLFTIALDMLKMVPNEDLQDVLVRNTNNAAGSAILLAGTLIFMIFVMIITPVFIKKIWLCKPLENKDLLERLEALCSKARFKHAGILTWTVMNNSLTAAIVGIVPRFRYIMFTKRILRELSPDAIEAVLAHEIGHSYRRHLLIYPLIILGMIVAAGIFSLLFSDAIDQFLVLEDMLQPSRFWEFLSPFLIFIPFALILGLYFRFVFGFFSRQFERQADLHVFELGIPADHMIEALNDVAIATGNTHSQPSWHHYSIQQRIDFLEEAKKDPKLISGHHAWVKRIVWAYSGLLLIGLLIFLSPLLPETSPFSQINKGLTILSSSISNALNDTLENSAAESYMEKQELKGDPVLIQNALKDAIRRLASVQMPGLVDFEAAKILYTDGQLSASATLMAQMWNTFDFSRASPEMISIFTYWTHRILADTAEKKEYEPEHKKLTEAFDKAPIDKTEK